MLSPEATVGMMRSIMDEVSIAESGMTQRRRDQVIKAMSGMGIVPIIKPEDIVEYQAD